MKHTTIASFFVIFALSSGSAFAQDTAVQAVDEAAGKASSSMTDEVTAMAKEKGEEIAKDTADKAVDMAKDKADEAINSAMDKGKESAADAAADTAKGAAPEL